MNAAIADLLNQSMITRTEFLAECARQKIDLPHIVTGLKRSLSAEKTQLVKIKGTIDKTLLLTPTGRYRKGIRIIAESADETLLSINMDELRLRFDAAKELAMLFDLRPAEKHEHGGPGGGPIEISELTNLEAAMRLNHLIENAVKRQKEGKE